jgi:hypothetical protein
MLFGMAHQTESMTWLDFEICIRKIRQILLPSIQLSHIDRLIQTHASCIDSYRYVPLHK